MLFNVSPQYKPVLDPGFVPAVLWNRAYCNLIKTSGEGLPIALTLERSEDAVSTFHTKIMPHEGQWVPLNQRYMERLLKTLLWLKGGFRVTVAGDPRIAAYLKQVYSQGGLRSFDADFMGTKIYKQPFEIIARPYEQAPREKEPHMALGRNLNGCRIGFDLGGSDRKCAAIKDGQVLFTEEVPWDPYFQNDLSYHYEGINDSLRRAAAHLPRVDAIGGSAAGVYVNNEVRAASLFRGVPRRDFEAEGRRIFLDLKKEWNNVSFEVVNDGEVTALAGAMSMDENAVLGVAMGTSEAAGYINAQGKITSWLNELAFVPIDFQKDAPLDEWSGDEGCGVQYFSQQAVGRLMGPAKIPMDKKTPLPDQLKALQNLMSKGDSRAKKVYETIGTYLGYAVAHYSEFYEIKNLLLLGRVTSGDGCQVILSKAKEVLEGEFNDLAQKVKLRTPGERDKRHGQAVAAASLPKISAN